jgi:hypothetical protein
MKRVIVVANVGLVVWLAWRVHQGTPIERAITLGFLVAVTINGAYAIKWFRTRDKPKPKPTGQFPWRQWAIGAATVLGYMILIALQGATAADLAFLALLAFGAGSLLTVVFWLWDRHTLRRAAACQHGSAHAAGDEELGSH